MRVRISLTATCLAIMACVCGCGQKSLSHNTTYPTKGRILFNGQPASYVIVRFEPIDAKGVEATGRTDQDGLFELRTYSNEEADGAVPGEYKVVIEAFNPVRAGGLPRSETDKTSARDDGSQSKARDPQ